MTVKWGNLEELAGHAGTHLVEAAPSEESSIPFGTVVWGHQGAERPKSVLGTFLSSATEEATRALPARNLYDLYRSHQALRGVQAGRPQAAQQMASEQSQQALSEREHPTAAGLGRFLGALPAFAVAGEAVEPLTSLPWITRMAQAGRMGKGVAQATQLGGQFGMMEAIQGRPSAIPSGVAQGALLGGFLGAAQPSATLSGKTVEEAQGALEAKHQAFLERADVEARKYRRPTETVSGGQLEVPAKEALAREAKFAWEPARTLAQSIQEPISYQELAEAGQRRFGTSEDEARLQNAMGLFQKVYKTGKGKRATLFLKQKTADELVSLSSEFGGKIPQTIKSGKGPAKVSTLDEIDARSIIADVLHEKAPDYLKNSFQEAKERWQDYVVGFRDPTHKYLQIGTSAAQETKPAIDLFIRVANRQETPTERRFLQKLEQELGMELFKPLRTAGTGLEAAKKQVVKAQEAKRFAQYVARAAVVSPLLYLFTRRPLYQALRK